MTSKLKLKKTVGVSKRGLHGYIITLPAEIGREMDEKNIKKMGIEVYEDYTIKYTPIPEKVVG